MLPRFYSCTKISLGPGSSWTDTITQFQNKSIFHICPYCKGLLATAYAYEMVTGCDTCHWWLYFDRYAETFKSCEYNGIFVHWDSFPPYKHLGQLLNWMAMTELKFQAKLTKYKNSNVTPF